MANMRSERIGGKMVRIFPVLGDPFVKGVPLSLMQKHEKQILINHCGQSIERLAERGGLSPLEAVYAIKGEDPFKDKSEDVHLVSYWSSILLHKVHQHLHEQKT